MTNAMIIETLAKRHIEQVTYLQAEHGLTYEQAKARIQAASIAGPAVWSIVDERFAQVAA